MSIISIEFLLFVIVCLISYYVVPKKHRWIVLLIFSYAFYSCANLKAIPYILITTLSTFLIAKRIECIGKENDKKSKKKLYVLFACIINFGMLFFFKYWDFFADTINQLTSGENIPVLSLILPLGISFYMFQSIGYVIDIYRGKHETENNIFKYALFVSFFPQIIQGPINRFKELQVQLVSGSDFSFDHLKDGTQTIFWGLFKKLVIADRAAVVVNSIVPNYEQYDGAIIVIAILLYCIQLYMDFSGGIEIVSGVSKLFGIKLAQNFNRPIFATSYADFWRRWHMSLGAWMKDYLFYPISLSKPFIKFGKFIRRKIKGKLGKIIPVSIATFIVYFAIGVWHGSSFKYVAFGLWNGSIITLAILFEPLFISIKDRLRIKDTNPLFKLFQIIRTSLIVFVGRYITKAPRFLASIAMLKMSFTNFTLDAIKNGELLNLGIELKDYVIMALGVVIVIAIEAFYEKGIDLRKKLDSKNGFVQWLAMLMIIVVILYLGVFRGNYIASEFIYKGY